MFVGSIPSHKNGRQTSMFRILGRVFYGLSVGSVALSLVLWLQRQKQPSGIARLLWRPNYSAAERAGIFVGLWAPTLAIMGKAMEDMDGQASMKVADKGASSIDGQQNSTSEWERVQPTTAGRS